MVSLIKYHRGIYRAFLNETRLIVPYRLRQFETARIYLRPGREFPNGSAAHGTKQGISRNKLHAAESESGSSHDGGPRILPGAHEASGDLPQREQRFVIETGTDLLIKSILVCQYPIKRLTVNTMISMCTVNCV